MKLTDESLMPWGKEHRGKKMANVPASYLDWAYSFIVEKNINSISARDLKIYIDENRDVINEQLKKGES